MARRIATKVVDNHAPALLVDDHPDVLVTIGAFLEAAGFDVVRASSGDEALLHLVSGKTFALLVTDYAMPGLNGVDLAKQALERLPDLKVVIITGFPSDAGLFDRPASVALLAKPFRRAALIARLQTLFGSGQQALPNSFD
jgi:CheY-like chemotaxis protein